MKSGLLSRVDLGLPWVVFLILVLNGSLLGLTDDEAYYWVLAQRPALGYAYHPPMVAWMIAFFQAGLGWAFGENRAGLVRAPAALGVALVLSITLRWYKEAGLGRERTALAIASVLSFIGLFALSWMMVPDIPLIFGWMVLFSATWSLCFDESGEIHQGTYLKLMAGSVLAMLSKYSAILAVFSSAIAMILWAQKNRKWKGVFSVSLGVILAALPILTWNQAHEWGSILYQIRDRHSGGSFSVMRFIRFWMVESLLCGPLLFVFLFILPFLGFLKSSDVKNPGLHTDSIRVYRFCAVWALPAAAVFCLQPLWSDFKPHWALIVWWPVALALGWRIGKGELSPRSIGVRVQFGYAIVLGVFVLFACHFPLAGILLQEVYGQRADPKWDVTNDMYGWADLPAFLRLNSTQGGEGLPLVGSRYQTASQIAFAFGSKHKAALLPRDVKARDEWPELSVSETIGPGWPRLKSPILFVADNRYDAGPEFPGADCRIFARFEKKRWNYPAKKINVWKCDPE